jgi:hypothetical protein
MVRIRMPTPRRMAAVAGPPEGLRYQGVELPWVYGWRMGVDVAVAVAVEPTMEVKVDVPSGFIVTGAREAMILI